MPSSSCRGTPGSPASAPRAADLEAAGYDGIWASEVAHDPFLPVALAAQATEHVELGTGIAVAFARTPMTLAYLAYDLQRCTRGPVRARPRQPDQAAHRAPVLDAVDAPGRPHAGVRRGAAGHLGRLAGRATPLRFQGEFYTPHPDDAVLLPGPEPVRRRRRSTSPRVGELMTAGRRRGRRRAPAARLHHRALPARAHPARAGARRWPSAGRSRGRRRGQLPGLRRDGHHRGGDGDGGAAVMATDRLLRQHPGLPAGAGAARLGRPRRRAQRAVGRRPRGQVEGDARPGRRRGARRRSPSSPSREDVAAAVAARFGGLVDRFTFYAPYAVDPAVWQPVLEQLRAVTATTGSRR